MLYNRKIDRVVIVVVPVAIFVYASTRPIFHLRSDMPLQFTDLAPSATPKARAAEEQLAQKYWHVAVSVVQWQYTHASPLPDTPPESFQVRGGSPSDPKPLLDSRLRYWRRLQQVWLLPDAWTTSREWSTQWLTEPLMRLGDWFDRSFKDWVGRP